MSRYLPYYRNCDFIRFEVEKSQGLAFLAQVLKENFVVDEKEPSAGARNTGLALVLILINYF